jgi:hypothetical protein
VFFIEKWNDDELIEDKKRLNQNDILEGNQRSLFLAQ